MPRALGLLILLALPAAAQGPGPFGARPILRAPPGVRFLALAASGGAVYVCDERGVVHASLAGGAFRARAALLADELPMVTAPRDASVEPEEGAALVASDPFLLQQGYGYVGENVYLDYDQNVQFRQSVGDLFAFPYGTTGEAYLELTPDSPAFWDAPWFTNMARPDLYYVDPTLSAPPTAGADGGRPGARAALDHVVLSVDAADPRTATLRGSFGARVTHDGGATWLPHDESAQDAPDDDESSADDEGSEGTVLALATDGGRRYFLRTDALLLDDGTAAADAIELRRERLPLLTRARAKEPPPDRVFSAALARAVPPLDEGAGLAPFVPRVDLVAGGLLVDNLAVLDAVFLDATVAGDGGYVRQTAEQVTENQSEVAFTRRVPASSAYLGVVLTWDLPALWSPATEPRERAARAEEHRAVEEQVRAALERRDAILEDLVLATPLADEELLAAALDLEEVNAHLLALSGVDFPRIGGSAGRALAAVPATGSAQDAIERTLRRLGLTRDPTELRAAALARAAVPIVLLGASALETKLDEDDYLDEIGATLPWVTKSGRARLGELRARLTWNLPRTLRPREQPAIGRATALRRAVSLEAAARWSAARRAYASGDAIDIEERTALLSGLTGATTTMNGGER